MPENSTYRGRFAPSPSGSLHMGSMLAALGSYLQAKSRKGKWLVRIEDVDPPREVKGATSKILSTLEKHGLLWDEDVIYQKNQQALYQHALSELDKNAQLFKCTCTRKNIQRQAAVGKMGFIYPGTCRNRNRNSDQYTTRLKSEDMDIAFVDALQGDYSQNIIHDIGDVILKRADGVYAYHLASIVDDNFQNITEVVRGIDLISCTPIQIYLRKQLNCPIPKFLHLPVMVDNQNVKLSKQTGAEEIDNSKVGFTLNYLLNVLGQSPPKTLQNETTENILNWAISHWDYTKITNIKKINLINSMS